jgi:hypoxanthine phosphoribosyltransferase
MSRSAEMSRAASGPARPSRVLIEQDELRTRVAELGGAIARDYERDNPVLVGVLKGALVFMADLIRVTPIELTTDFIVLSSYGSGTRSSGVVKLASDLSMPVEDRHVIIVEDIIDTGRTVSYLKRNLETRHPRSVRLCALLDKVERREVEVDIDYPGFAIPDVYVVGYGLDHGGLYRNLPHIAVVDDGEAQARPGPR